MPFVGTWLWYTKWSVEHQWLAFLCRYSNEFNSHGNLTVCTGLVTGLVWCAPQIHPRVRYVGSPGEIDRVDIIEGQTAVLGTRKDPVHVAVTGKDEDSPTEKGGENGAAAVSIAGRGGKRSHRVSSLALSHRYSGFAPVKRDSKL